LRVNTTVAGSWGIGIDRMRVGSTVIDGTKLYVGLSHLFALKELTC
jgi:hypothetical protein